MAANKQSRLFILIPFTMIQGAFLISLAIIFVYSFCTRGQHGEIIYHFTFENYTRVFTDSAYLPIFLRSLLLALCNTVLCVVIGYPVAYFIAKSNAKVLLISFLILPFWTSFLIRTYAWIFILRSNGFLNSTLALLHIGSVDILFTTSSVILGLVYNYIPFMIFAIYSALHRFDFGLIDAAKDLGANSTRSFLTITFPISLPGVVAGSLLVFIPTFGEFVVPDLLGGGKNLMLGNLIKIQFLEARDWPFGAAITVIAMAIAMLIILVCRRVTAKGVY